MCPLPWGLVQKTITISKIGAQCISLVGAVTQIARIFATTCRHLFHCFTHCLCPPKLAAMASVQKRLVADPNIGIGDLMKAIQQYVEETGDLDLFQAVDPPGHHAWSWKTAPNCAWMAKVSVLALHILDVAPNGVLSSSKLKNAVTKLCGWKKVNKTRFADCDFADQVDHRLRVVLAQFRLLKQKTEEHQKAIKKATPWEKEKVDKVMSKLVLDTLETVDGPVPFKDLQIVPVQASAVANPSSSSAMASIVPVGMGFASVFRNLLEKDFSSPDKEVAPVPSAPSTFSKPRMQLSNFNCVPPEDVTSSEASPQQPRRKRKSKSPLSAPKTPERKKMVCAGSDLDDEDFDILHGALAVDVPKTKSKGAAKTKTKPKVSKKPAGKGVNVWKGASPKKEEEKAKTKKSSWQRRKTSSAYHSARLLASKEGKSPNTCKVIARAAHQKMANDIAAGLVKEGQ